MITPSAAELSGCPKSSKAPPFHFNGLLAFEELPVAQGGAGFRSLPQEQR